MILAKKKRVLKHVASKLQIYYKKGKKKKMCVSILNIRFKALRVDTHGLNNTTLVQ